MNMSKIALRNSLVAALAVAMLPLLSGCGGSSDTAGPDTGSGSGSTADGGTKTADGAVQLTIPDGTNDETRGLYIEENALAACMKKQGFTYTPHVAAPSAEASHDWIDGQDYALAKKQRQKYGFGTYAGAAYPDDPAFSTKGGKVPGKTITPEDGDEEGLTAAQRKSYQEALMGIPPKTGTKAEKEKPRGCSAEARLKAYGPEQSIEDSMKDQAAREETNRTNGLALNGDPQLVQLAQEYANCLKAQGIPVSTTQPTGMSDMVRIDLTSKLPEHRPELTQAQALPLLNQDIDIALKDLECGKDFRAAYFPKEKANPYWGEGQ